jgi:hypothetical protein
MSWMDEAPKIPVYVSTTQVARKEYLCNLCKKHIHPGQKYTRTFWMEDGLPQVQRVHEPIECRR